MKLGSGYPPKMLQEMMRHTSITTALDLHGHFQLRRHGPLRGRIDTGIEEAGTAKVRDSNPQPSNPKKGD